MVCINAGLLLSPDLSITSPYLKGAADMYEDGVFVTVDLNFLVDAHICVFEDVSTYGRYLCFNHAINCNENEIKLAKLLYPQADQRLVIHLTFYLITNTKIKFLFEVNLLVFNFCSLCSRSVWRV